MKYIYANNDINYGFAHELLVLKMVVKLVIWVV